MNQIQITPLGAGQDVGRSCILVTLGDKNILLDCGMHMGYDDARRFPDFSYISTNGDFNDIIDCVLISHFHLDHCGALPYFTEMCGYDGPVLMTGPTRAICPLLLEDYRKITVDRRGGSSSAATVSEQNFFTSEDIKKCMKKVSTINLHQTVKVADDLFVTAYYAGHVIGAAMFLIRSGDLSVVYTGDYNMTPDRHLGAAWIDRVRPDVLITETTYATTIRDSKRARESDFLKKVHNCIDNGGKVLIPVFALGRAQELCILIESYWERMGLKVPVYFSGGMTKKANNYYRLFINWTNQKLKQTFSERNMFDFKHIKEFDMAYADNPGPQVFFASPGMLHAGYSLEIFKKWAPNPKNMVILPGYCVPGTVGAKVLAGETKISIDQYTTIDVNLQVKHLSFSAHADMKGILQLIDQCNPTAVVLVHGEASKMNILKQKIINEYGKKCYDPANGDTVCITKEPMIDVDIPRNLLQKSKMSLSDTLDLDRILPCQSRAFQGALLCPVLDKNIKFLSSSNFNLFFKCNIGINLRSAPVSSETILQDAYELCSKTCSDLKLFQDKLLIISNGSHIEIFYPVDQMNDGRPDFFTIKWALCSETIAKQLITALSKLY